MKNSSSKRPTSSSASRRTRSAAAMAQSTSRVSLPPDWRMPARPSVSSPRAAVAGDGKREAARDQRLAGGIHGVHRLLPLEPREQVAHPVLECDLRPESEPLLRQPRVGEAVPDVAGAVLLDDLRLDLLV